MPTTVYACLIGLFISMFIASGLVIATLARSSQISRQEERRACEQAQQLINIEQQNNF